MNLSMIRTYNREYFAFPRFSKGETVDRLAITDYAGRHQNPTGNAGLQHLYDVQCECGNQSQWYQVDLIRKRVGPKECDECRIDRNLKRKEARKKSPLTSGNITPKNVLTRAWK